jgi:putative ABC transport system permease protein
MNEASLGPADLAIAGALLLASAGLSLALGLGLARTIVVAGARTMLQLTLVGFVLGRVFASASPGMVLAAAVVMTGAATYEIVARQERPLRGFWRYGLGGASMAAATVLVVAVGYTTHLRPDIWYDPRVLVPLIGIVLGSVMSAVSVGLNGLGNVVTRERSAIEARLALGATRFEALGGPVRGAIRAGLIPILNQMSAAGLVTLPGMMTGQILAGADPRGAAAYQILTLFLLASAGLFGTVAAVYGAAWRLTDARHRLRLDRLGPPRR